MAKVLLINGSPRKNGNTFTALSEVAKTLNEEGVEAEIVNIVKQTVQRGVAYSLFVGVEAQIRYRCICLSKFKFIVYD